MIRPPPRSTLFPYPPLFRSPMQDVPAVTTASDGRYLVFLGRMSAEKRPDLAIAVAKRAGLPLIMAAKVDRPDREYFEREIDRKSTRLNSSHSQISYAVFCLK